MTGQYPLTNGLFINDVPLNSEIYGIGDVFADNGYDTGYIGKWHANSNGRENPIPKENRKGFDYWKVLECTHDYNNSPYYEGDSEEKKYWEGYDVFAQTADAQNYIAEHANNEKPFFLVLSIGTPHDPYQTAPEKYKQMYNPDTIKLRNNVDVAPEYEKLIREWTAGYYAHCSAADASIGDLLNTIEYCDIKEDTIVIFTSDHGDMLGSHGLTNKQVPYNESIQVPFLLRYPQKFGENAMNCSSFIDAPDIMPTLLGLCDLAIPESVEGLDISLAITDKKKGKDCDVIAAYHPFGQACVANGGRAYRGIVTEQDSYVQSLEGNWFLFDNIDDPYQQNNLMHKHGDEETKELLNKLKNQLKAKLEERNDKFENGMTYVNKWGYKVGSTGTLGY